MAWVSVEDVKSFIETDSTEHDTVIQDLINYVEGLFKAKIERTLDIVQYEEICGLDDNKAILTYTPITQVVSIYVDEAEITSDNYLLNTKHGIFVLRDMSGSELKIRYYAGYDTIPEEVKQAIKMQVAFLLSRKTARELRSVTRGGENDIFIDEIFIPEFVEVIEIYRITPRWQNGIVREI